MEERIYARVRFTGNITVDNEDGELIIERRIRNQAQNGCWTRLCMGASGGTKLCRELRLLGAFEHESICTPECEFPIGAPCGGQACVNGPGLGGRFWSDGTHIFQNNFEYRIRTSNGTTETTGVVYSDVGQFDPADGVVVEPNDAIRFYVGCLCVADLNGDGVISTPDIQKFLGTFGQNAPACPTAAPGCGSNIPEPFVGDINGDGTVSTPDLTILLGQFGTTCPVPPCDSSLAASAGGIALNSPGASGRGTLKIGVRAPAAVASEAGTPPGPIIGALGFASAEAYQSYLNTLTDAELQVHLLLVLELAKNIETPSTP